MADPRMPVRVLQVLAQDAIGGTELMVATLIERMDRARVECELATMSRSGPIGRRLGAGGVPVHSLGDCGVARGGIRLGSLLRGRRFDVIVPYGFRAGLAGRIAARIARPRPKVVIGVQGLLVTEAEEVDSPKARVVEALERATSRWVDAYDANSSGAADRLAQNGISSDRITYIPPGIDLDAWRPGDGNAPDGPPVVACFARFVPIKRHFDLIRALSSLEREGIEFEAILAGDGPTRRACEALVGKLGLLGRVHLPGTIPPERVAELLSRSAVACLPSVWEGMPSFVMEAMGVGIPVVASRVNGPDALVVEGETGFLVPPLDPDALASALRRVLEDPALAARLGAAGRRRIEGWFSATRMVEAKQELYERVASS